jgi:uncharacterized membrane protein
MSGYVFLQSDISGNALMMVVFCVTGALLLGLAWAAVSKGVSIATDTDPASVRHRALWPFLTFIILPLLYLPYFYYRNHGKQYIPGISPLDPSWQMLFVLLLSAGLVFAFLAYRFPFLRRGPIDAATRRPAISLAIMITIWSIAVVILNLLQVNYLNQPGNNSAIFSDMLDNAFSDRGLLFSELAQAEGSSILGVHAQLIWFIVYPFYLIWPSYQWLLILSDVALALAAVPLYLLSRRFFNPGVSLLIAAVFLFNRIILAQPAVGDLSEERFLPMLLLSAFYFWQTKKYKRYLLFTFLMLLVREDTGLVLVMFGLVSALNRRSLKWTMVPIIAGLSWVGTMMLWLIPHMNPTGSATKPVVLYSSLGENSREILKTIIFKPWVVIRTAFSSVSRFGVMYGLWQSFAFGAPLISASVLIALPATAESFLASTPIGLNHFNMLAPAAALFPSLVLGMDRAERIARNRWNIPISTGLAVITLFATLALSYTWFSPGYYKPSQNYEAAVSMIEMIPSDASVMMPKYMMVKAQGSQRVKGYYQAEYEYAQKGDINLVQDYIIIDSSEVPESWKSDVQEFRGRERVIDSLDSSPDYILVFSEDNLKMFQRTETR